ncbi:MULTISPECIES: peptidase T [unclassified Nosocomiicoccus]|uniref:peptidase T n=1 Tax=unclassified Nosocomiicoccus TaxID=2646683 RepID=UPI0008A32B3D|nr:MULTISPECIES: peptidase T [unclassified Nosocomiicoccus]OFO54469.1 peptidase T [Nosocomiicoccus sp. HMSC059G07]OFS61485.1 peptidase T [Nosocomiicoccus sp. HMSC09A07]
MKEQLTERLIRYAKVDTQSDASSKTTPSTSKQWDLLHMLKEELEEIGLSDITLDDNGYLFATIPGNVDAETVGFLAHVDTATDFTGTNVNPQVVQYKGGDIILNRSQDIVMTVKEFPNLNNYIGHTLITTDGTTLLGGDDKAGITAIVTAAEAILNSDIEHGDIRIAFTPDEEIGRGPHKFDVEKFNADFAYTIDGGPVGELQYESFNAAGAKVIIKGKNIHPGTAKDKMINSLTIASKFALEFDPEDTPECSEGYEGFFHLLTINGSTDETELEYIIRDFDRDNFENRKETMKKIVEKYQDTYGPQNVRLELEDQYYNMKEKIEPKFYIVEIAQEAMKSLDISPVIQPVRGGTDGSQLSFMGLPTPNIFTGTENMHGRYEFTSVNDLEKATKTIIEIVKRIVQK